jgi:hypothetical protein
MAISMGSVRLLLDKASALKTGYLFAFN